MGIVVLVKCYDLVVLRRLLEQHVQKFQNRSIGNFSNNSSKHIQNIRSSSDLGEQSRVQMGKNKDVVYIVTAPTTPETLHTGTDTTRRRVQTFRSEPLLFHLGPSPLISKIVLRLLSISHIKYFLF